MTERLRELSDMLTTLGYPNNRTKLDIISKCKQLVTNYANLRRDIEVARNRMELQRQKTIAVHQNAQRHGQYGNHYVGNMVPSVPFDGAGYYPRGN